MWTTTRRKLALLLEEQELLRRTVQGLQYDLGQLTERVQRLIWRTRKAPPPDTDESGASPDAGAAAGIGTSPVGTDGTAGAAPGSASRGLLTSATDPVSARLLARRRRLPVASDDKPPSEG